MDSKFLDILQQNTNLNNGNPELNDGDIIDRIISLLNVEYLSRSSTLILLLSLQSYVLFHIPLSSEALKIAENYNLIDKKDGSMSSKVKNILRDFFFNINKE